MSRMLRAAALQLCSGVDFSANLSAVSAMVREAATAGARFVVTPEMTGRLDRDRERLSANLARADLEAEQRAWSRLAQEHSVWLLLGSAPIPAPDGRIHNRSVLFDPGGKAVAHYDKIHLFEASLGEERYRESDGVAPGTKAALANGPMGAKLGLTICYDLRFPALYKRLAMAGAEIIAAPSAFTVPTGRAHWETLVRARAIETGAFLVAAAQGGFHEDGRRTYGRTMIVSPWGEIVKSLPDEQPGLVIADLDLDLVADARGKIPAWRTEVSFEGP